MVKKHAKTDEVVKEELAEYEKKAKLKLERRLRGDDTKDTPDDKIKVKKTLKDIEKLKMTNVK
jgi:hypothetical protein